MQMLLPQRIKGHEFQLAFVYYYIWSRIMTSSLYRWWAEQHPFQQHVYHDVMVFSGSGSMWIRSFRGFKCFRSFR